MPDIMSAMFKADLVDWTFNNLEFSLMRIG